MTTPMIADRIFTMARIRMLDEDFPGLSSQLKQVLDGGVSPPAVGHWMAVDQSALLEALAVSATLHTE